MKPQVTILEMLQLVERGRVYHTVREGGNEPYRVNRILIKHLLDRHLIYQVKESCCKTTFKLTEQGEEYLHGRTHPSILC